MHESTSRYGVLYRFRGGLDGAAPAAGLIAVKGIFYGTTFNGGGARNWGTVFAIDRGGNERVIYRFKNGTDGAGPNGDLLYDRSWLCSTTVGGGTGTQCIGTSCGTVFAVKPSGKERVLYRFPGGAAGGLPYAGLAKMQGVFYGMTSYGGRSVYCKNNNGEPACGTVFSASADGAVRVLHMFKGPPDGFAPYGDLLAYKGMLFGLTANGGVGNCCETVFSITPAGVERVIYRFKAGSDGGLPQGGLTEVRGRLYGMTTFGGLTGSTNYCGNNGCGIVFAVTQFGAERIVYRFQGHGDGANPTGTLIWDGSKFYGTTGGGGAISTACPQGCGTVFSLTPSGQERVLYRFKGGNDGSRPGSKLLMVKGALYGVTEVGGGKRCGGAGCGTVFALKP